MSISTKSDRRWSALALIVTAQFMVILDVAIVNVALPSIKSDLNFSQANLQWVISAYAIMFGGALLLGGRLADLLGRRRLFVAGLALFAASSLLCGLAWSEGSLIAFRAVQGLGGALLAPAALSLLMTRFAEGRERNLALGIYGAASGSGAAAGVLLGGVLTSYLSWSWIFLINVPVGVAAIALTPLLLQESRADLAHRHFDLPGAASITALAPAIPIAPPIWRLVFTRPEATPASERSTPCRLAIVSGTNERPRPAPPTTNAGRRSETYRASSGSRVSHATEAADASSPAVNVVATPKRATTGCARFDAATTLSAKPAKAAPLWTAL